MALGKETFADGFFADCSLPSAALGKAFAECNRGFAECPKHSAKSPSAVVGRALVGRALGQGGPLGARTEGLTAPLEPSASFPLEKSGLDRN